MGWVDGVNGELGLTHKANSGYFGVDDHPEYDKVRSRSSGIPDEHEQSAMSTSVAIHVQYLLWSEDTDGSE